MLKPQDCMLLLKIIANGDKYWSQRELARELCISVFEVNKSIKRLINSELLRKDINDERKLLPNLSATKEYLIHGLKYSFPAKLGEITPGIPTGVGAQILRDKFLINQELLPVWPYGKGKTRGAALKPLYKSVPQSLEEHPDNEFYNLLALVDAIRCGRARERKYAIELLTEKLELYYGKNR